MFKLMGPDWILRNNSSMVIEWAKAAKVMDAVLSESHMAYQSHWARFSKKIYIYGFPIQATCIPMKLNHAPSKLGPVQVTQIPHRAQAGPTHY